MIERYLNGHATRSKHESDAAGNRSDWNPQYNHTEELRNIIRAELKLINQETLPHVTAMRKTSQGEKQIVEMIVRYVTEECKPIVIALMLIEKELREVSNTKS